MVGFSKALCLGLGICALAACHKRADAPPPVKTETAVAPADALAVLLERYSSEHIVLDDVIGTQRLADARDIERRYLDALSTLPRESLDADGKLNYDLFKRERELAVEGFTYPEELQPLKPFASPPLKLAAAAVASGQRSLGVADYEAWLKAIESCGDWLVQARANLREGLGRGYTEPRPLIERVLPQFERLARDAPDNPFYEPLKVMAENVPAGERERITRAYNAAVSRRLLPALRDLHDFLAKEYLPKARTTLSLGVLPLGPAWYAYRLRRATGLDTPAADLHKQGLAEVDKLKARGLPADTAPRPVADLLTAYPQLAQGYAPRLASLFDAGETPPPLPGVAALEFPLEPGSVVSYLRPPAGLPASLYLYATGAGGRYSVPDFLAAGAPGAYWRQALLERGTQSRYRREARAPAYTQGWAMYAAGLGEELGVYTDEALRGQWQARQLRCAAGLVVDTGLHTQGWTRDKAVDYLRAQTMIEPADAQALVYEIVASPGDAAACELGFSKFQQLRARAQQVLGARFDFKEFHAQLLGAGALPLDVLEAKVKAWLERSR